MGDAGHALDRFEHACRSDAAVDADHRDAELFELRDERLRRDAVERVAVFLGGHLGDDRQIRESLHGANRRRDLVHVMERLEHEQVDAAVDQSADLFAEVGFRFVDAGLPPGLDANPQRTDRTRDVRLLPRGVPGDACALGVDRLDPLAQTEGRELDAVGAEGIRFDHVGPGPYVRLVHFSDQVGLRQVQLVERPVEKYPFRVQHRPHRAIADENTA